jgi:hypothetical protein
MGILDNLREEASQNLADQKEAALRREKLENNYQRLVLPKMQQLYTYFKELIDYLSVIEKPIAIPCYSKRYSQLGELYQQNYRLSTDKHGGIANFEKLTEITLRYHCLGKDEDDNEFVHCAEHKIEADQEQIFLSEHKIPFHSDRHLGNTSKGARTFYITRKIPVAFKFTVDYEKARLNLSIINHDNFEVRTQIVNPEQINESYMDKLARYILRKDNDFIKMDIDESHKKTIRQHVENQKKAHAEELQAAYEREQNEKKIAEENKLENRIKSFFNKITK